MDRRQLSIAAVTGFLAVIAGTFGAHGLDQHLSEQDRGIFETGVRYHMYHALAMLATVGLGACGLGRWAVVAGRFFLAGVTIFSGSLYLLVLTGARWLGMITPLGGVILLAGWVVLIIGAVRAPSPGAGTGRNPAPSADPAQPSR